MEVDMLRTLSIFFGMVAIPVALLSFARNFPGVNFVSLGDELVYRLTHVLCGGVLTYAFVRLLK